MNNQYKRILLKLSGESLMGEKQYGIDEKRIAEYATQIKEIADMGIEIGIVIGGGNIFRGLSGTSKGVDRVKVRPNGHARDCNQQFGIKLRIGKNRTKSPSLHGNQYVPHRRIL